ncbi:endonuclease domain-containing protein [Roseibium sp.]|uniref:endonuclease domain-containing protein n=1 Tax=Roseibium sp. TaxID=1936156 RepID=UPI003A97B4B0
MAPSRVDKPAINRARKLRRAMTEGEKRLWSKLKEFRSVYGFHVRRQVPIGPYVADFTVHSAKLIIEVDGEGHDEIRQVEHDKKRDDWFAQAGYKTIRFSTGELIETFDGCLEQILRELGAIK